MNGKPRWPWSWSEIWLGWGRAWAARCVRHLVGRRRVADGRLGWRRYGRLRCPRLIRIARGGAAVEFVRVRRVANALRSRRRRDRQSLEVVMRHRCRLKLVRRRRVARHNIRCYRWLELPGLIGRPCGGGVIELVRVWNVAGTLRLGWRRDRQSLEVVMRHRRRFKLGQG